MAGRTWVAGPLGIGHVNLDLRQLFALNVLLQVVDGLVTYGGIRVGMPEGNPLLSASIATVGTESGLLLSGALCLVAGRFVAAGGDRPRRRA